MRIIFLLAVALLAGCAAKHETATRSGPYQRGVSMETELMAARGQPLSRSVAPDGTITDIYSAGIDLSQMKKMRPDGKLVSLSDLASGLSAAQKADFAIKNH